MQIYFLPVPEDGSGIEHSTLLVFDAAPTHARHPASLHQLSILSSFEYIVVFLRTARSLTPDQVLPCIIDGAKSHLQGGVVIVTKWLFDNKSRETRGADAHLLDRCSRVEEHIGRDREVKYPVRYVAFTG